MRKRLHELIEMAERGEKFEAWCDPIGIRADQGYFSIGPFDRFEAAQEWTVRMKREPRELWVHEQPTGPQFGWYSYAEAHREATPNTKIKKFIEVIEEEKGGEG